MNRSNQEKIHTGFGQDQRGFSLVELIVTLAIVGIVSVGGLYSIGIVTGQNVKSCEKKLEAAINETRVLCLSKQQASMELYTDSDGVYVKIKYSQNDSGAETETVEKIAKAGVTVKYEDSAGLETQLVSGTKLTISFIRSSGAFKPISGTDNYCEAIILTDGTRERTIRMVPKTGKFYLD